MDQVENVSIALRAPWVSNSVKRSRRTEKTLLCAEWQQVHPFGVSEELRWRAKVPVGSHDALVGRRRSPSLVLF